MFQTSFYTQFIAHNLNFLNIKEEQKYEFET